MADNTVLNPGALGDTIATDDIAGVKHQRVKVQHGADGSATDVSAVSPMPIGLFTPAASIDTTSTPLGIGATYTSATIDTTVSGAFITHMIFADQVGDHYYDESHDGVTWHVVDGPDAITANETFVEWHLVSARYARTRFINGGVAQTVFNHQDIARWTGAPHNMGITMTDNEIRGQFNDNDTPQPNTKMAVLSALASASTRTLTEGNNVTLRTNLAGDLVITLDSETVPVTGTFWQATQPVSGPLTDTQLRATAVPISGSVGISAGTNNIGDVDVLTLPALPAGTNNIGDVDVASLVGGATIATNQISVGTGSTLIVAQRTGRRAVLVVNHGTVAVYVGVTGLTVGNGFLLPGILGATVSIPTSAAIYGIAGSAQTVSFMEVY